MGPGTSSSPGIFGPIRVDQRSPRGWDFIADRRGLKLPAVAHWTAYSEYLMTSPRHQHPRALDLRLLKKALVAGGQGPA